MTVTCIATLTAKTGSVDAVRDALTSAAVEFHDEPGCALYALHEADDRFVVVEQWESREHLHAHSAGPAAARMLKAVDGHLATAPEVVLVRPLPVGEDAKGALRP